MIRAGCTTSHSSTTSPPEDRTFDVRSIGKTSDGLYFQSYERLFRWDGQGMKVWRTEAENLFSFHFALNDTVYVEQQGIGLMRMVDDALVRVAGGELFESSGIRSVVAHGEAAYLVVTQRRGMFRCTIPRPAEIACTPFGPGLTERLNSLEVYHATLLPGGVLAIGTLRGGVVLVDEAGRLLRILNAASGLRDERVYRTYVDRQGGLWLCLNNGLARVETGAEVSYYDKSRGLLGIANGMARHRGRLYAATTRGVYRLEPGTEGASPRFLPRPGMSRQCWQLLSTPQGLLAGCIDGVYDVGNQERIAAFGKPVITMARSKRDNTLLYLGLFAGLARMHLRGDRWTDAEIIEGLRADVNSLAEDARGRLWMGTTNEGVLRLDAAGGPSDRAAVGRFGKQQGLPPRGRVMSVGGRIVFVSPDGVFRLAEPSPGTVRFVRDTGIEGFLSEDVLGRVWVRRAEASALGHPRPEGGYTWKPSALQRAPLRAASTAYAEADGTLWVGDSQGLIRHHARRALDRSKNYQVLIRQVTASTGPVLLGPRRTRSAEAPSWPYQGNALRFAFAAPRYAVPERTHYRTRLDGFDDDWSAWSTETDKDYTNLWEGRYVFHVEARDVYGVVSREDTFTFRILPPWYRTWWAYSLCGLALTAAVLVYVRSHRKELQRERQAAERERQAAERERQAAERERAVSARLREVDKLKDEFLANTSHELRTPLYGITGLAESLIDGALGELPEAAQANLSMIASSGRRLGQLVGDILDYSQLTHGSLELRRRPVDLRSLAEVVLALHRPLAAGKDLELRNAVAADLPAADADEARLEQILHNLVGNAVKFTEEGQVEISASVDADQLTVAVEDTGIGLAEDQQERIFVPFEQADLGIQRTFGGTGLGLTITRRLVDLHGGRIWAKATAGQGSRFAFTLPIAHEKAQSATQPVSRLSTVKPSAPLPRLDTERPRAPTDRGPADARILVVDDEPVILQVLSNQLTTEGYQVELATGGAEALHLVEQRAFDLIVLDVMMPKISGYEVCRSLREHHSLESLPVIFLTARNQVSDLIPGLAAGGNDYLAKPIGKDELLARVRTHLNLLSAHRQLAAKNTELALFNYTVAHDLKNPLTTITNFLGLARLDAASGRTERLVEDFDRLDAATVLLRRQLEELFKLSQVGMPVHAPEEVPFGDLVRQAVKELAVPLSESKVEIAVAEELPTVAGDRSRLLEAVRHLLSNAVQYLGEPAAPRIEIGMRKNGKDQDAGTPVFYVRDNGIGIDPKYHEKVFELFERLDPNASEGTGVGLALVKRIIEIHGGRVWVESEGVGGGSTFYFSLPRATERLMVSGLGSQPTP